MNLKSQMLSYTGVNILNAAVPFLLLPILTKYLNPSDYGLLSLIQLLMLISLPIVLMNTHGLLTIEYSKLSLEKFQRLVSTILWVPIVGFLSLEILFILLEEQIIRYFHIPLEYLYFIPLFVLFQVIPTIIPIIFQAKKEPLNFGKYKISMTISNILLSLLFVMVFNMNWEGRVYGIVGSFALFTIIGFFILYRLSLLKFTFDREFLNVSMKFGLPLIPHSIAGIFLAMSDRVFLVNMLGESSVGIYSVAFQIASAITIILSSINQAWAPNLFEKLNSNPTREDKRTIVKTTYKIMGIMTLITLSFIFISSVVFDIFIDESYHDGKTITNYIAVAFLFQGFYFMVTNYILYSKKTHILSYITLFSVLIVFVSNYLLISTYGVIGAAYAMIIVWVIFFFITWIVSNKIYKMPWSLKND